MNNNPAFRTQFETNLKLWKRYIDDCGGAYLGRELFLREFFGPLQEQFNKFGLLLTYEVSHIQIQLLDIEVFIDGQFHTREYRKETASNSYVKYGSAHPKHSFKGIVKSQMFRLRRLCSRDSDFMDAIGKLRQRCVNSGYDEVMVDSILSQANTLVRSLTPNPRDISTDTHLVRWVILSGSEYEKQIQSFASRINRTLINHNIKLEIVKSTGSCIGNLLFNNNVKSTVARACGSPNCNVCLKGLRPDSNEIVSPTNGRSYVVTKNINCSNAGIYCICCACLSLYTGKTTGQFNKRTDEHFDPSKSSAVLDHTRTCEVGRNKEDYTVQYLENMYSRGKYTLSEREYLWNERLRGILNIQKTLKR